MKQAAGTQGRIVRKTKVTATLKWLGAGLAALGACATPLAAENADPDLIFNTAERPTLIVWNVNAPENPFLNLHARDVE